jgi:hypothetical protein
MGHSFKSVLSWLMTLLALGSLGWLWWLMRSRSDDPAKFVRKSLLTAVLAAGEGYLLHVLLRGLHESTELTANFVVALMLTTSIVAFAVAMSAIWTSEISALLFRPLTDLFDGGNEAPEQKPFYYRALERRMMQKPHEAIVLIREQLAKFPDDFDGQMLLATIQAEDLDDIPGAEITLNHFCNSPKALERQVAAACTQLANWHLKKAADVESAQEALRKIMERYPGTDSALHAEQRIAQLAGTQQPGRERMEAEC